MVITVSNRESDGAKDGRPTWHYVFAVLVAILALGLVYTAISEQPDEAPSHYNESVSAFYEDCKSDGGTFLMETEDVPADDFRCEYENGSKEAYDADDW